LVANLNIPTLGILALQGGEDVNDETDDETDSPTLGYLSRIEVDEDDMAVKAERASLNMQYGGCGEVYGPDWAIQQLYSILEHTTAFDEDIEGQAGEWLDDSA
jgi:hypothetical protein